jgi:hypothetical protein
VLRGLHLHQLKRCVEVSPEKFPGPCPGSRCQASGAPLESRLGSTNGPGLIDAGEHNPKIGANTEIGSIPGFSIDIIPAIQLHVLLFAQAIFPVHSSRNVSRVEVGWGRMSHGIASLFSITKSITHRSSTPFSVLSSAV